MKAFTLAIIAAVTNAVNVATTSGIDAEADVMNHTRHGRGRSYTSPTYRTSKFNSTSSRLSNYRPKPLTRLYSGKE